MARLSGLEDLQRAFGGQIDPETFVVKIGCAANRLALGLTSIRHGDCHMGFPAVLENSGWIGLLKVCGQRLPLIFADSR